MADASEVELCKLIEGYLETNLSGGTLHIVLEDGNCEDDHVWACIVDVVEERDVDALVIAGRLILLPVERRYELYEASWRVQ